MLDTHSETHIHTHTYSEKHTVFSPLQQPETKIEEKKNLMSESQSQPVIRFYLVVFLYL